MSDIPEADMSEADELLRTAGEVPPTDPRVLEDARETLWSVIAEEMLGGQGGLVGEETSWRRRADVRQDEHRKSMGAGELADR
jgi:hypothetical protein